MIMIYFFLSMVAGFALLLAQVPVYSLDDYGKKARLIIDSDKVLCGDLPILTTIGNSECVISLENYGLPENVTKLGTIVLENNGCFVWVKESELVSIIRMVKGKRCVINGKEIRLKNKDILLCPINDRKCLRVIFERM